MRSYVIVFVVVAAGALIFVLARQAPDAAPVAPLSEPVIEIERANPTGAVEIETEVVTTNAATDAEPTAVTAEARKVAERITTCTLGGYVLAEGEERFPVSRAYVGLFRPAVGPDPDKVAFGQWTGPADSRPTQHQLLTWDYSDDEGKFEFDELAAGTYFVRVELGPLVVRVSEPQTLAPAEVRAGLLIRLPIAGGLNGTILAPPGVEFDEWQVGMQRKDSLEPPMYVEGLQIDLLKAGVEADGTFHLAPGEAGLHTVWLVGRTDPSIRRFPIKFPIGEVNIVAGQEAEQVFDLRAGFPGALRVTLRVPVLDGLSVPKSRLSHTLLAYPWSSKRDVPTGTGNCVVGAPAVIGPLVPGPWALRVQSNSSPWIFEVLLPQTVSPGQVDDVTIEVPLFAGELKCVDSVSGTPIVHGRIGVRPLVRDSPFAMGVDTDGDGTARLLVVPGSYAVYALKGFERGMEETVEWREDGPHPRSVTLLPPVATPR